jgi:serine/threonine protein kinase
MFGDERDMAFVHAGIRLGLLTLENLDEAIKIRGEMGAQGLQLSLEEILVKKGFLTEDQVRIVGNTLTIKSGIALPGMELKDRLWSSGYASWFRAAVEATGKTALVKVLSKTAGSRMAISERFIKEAKLHSRLRHPHLMRIYDATRTSGLVYMANEDAEGMSLKDLVLNSGPLSEEHALKILRQLVEAVAVIHKADLVHANIKPENVILLPGSVAKLSDPGQSRPILRDSQWDDPDPFAANFHYLAPEQIGGEPAGPPADVYSLGALFWFMTTGGTIFTGTDPRRLTDQYLRDPLPDLKEIFPDLSEKCGAMARRMLQRDPKDRFADGSSLAAELGVDVPKGGFLKTTTRMPPVKEETAPAPPVEKKVEKRAEPKPAPPPPPPKEARPEPPRASKPEPAPPAPPPPPKRPDAARRRRVLLVVAAALAVVVGGYLALRPAAKPPMVRPPPVDPAQKLEDEARAALDAAEAEFKAENWKKAEELYGALESRFGSTRLFAQEKAAIADRLAACRRSLQGRADARQLAEFAEAKKFYDQGSYNAALPHLESLLRALPESEPELRPQLRAMIDSCYREIACTLDLEKLRSMAQGGDLEKAAAFARDFALKHADTQQFKAAQKEVEAIQARADRALEFAQTVRSIREARKASQWAETAALIEGFNAKFSDHPNFGLVRDEFAELLALAKKNLSITPEDRAQRAYAAAEAHLDARRYREAVEAYDALLRDFADTDFVRSNRTLISQHRGIGYEFVKRDRETEAFRRLKAAQALFEARQWADARKALAELDSAYADVLGPRAPDVKSMLQRCDRELGLDRTMLIDDLEKGAAAWKPAGAAGKIEIAESADAQEGSKSLKLTFKSHADSALGDLPRAQRAVTPPDESTSGLSFWARAEKGDGFKLTVELRLFSGDDELLYSTTRSIGPGWQLYQIPLAEFRLAWQNPARKLPAKLTAFNIERVAWTSGSTGSEAVILIDWIRFEARK